MNQLGKSDLLVSEVSFGCMSLGEKQVLNTRLLHKAADQGINFFDTADLYNKGLNELQAGTALKDIRKNVIIATKVGNQWRADGSGWDWNPRKDYMLKAAEQSLKRLKTDYIDLYQLHGGTIDDPVDETIEAFEQLKEQGKIRWYGISSIRPNVIRTYAERSNIVSVMMQYSLLDQRPGEEMLDFLQQQHIAVLARGTLAGGLLTGKQPGPYLQYTGSEVARAAKQVSLVAAEVNRGNTAVAQAFACGHPAIASAVTGIRTAEQLDELLDVLKNPVQLSLPQTRKLTASVRRFNYQDHRS